jgi:tRNA threonylcarbamoyl adenosine modification protein YeaZ
MKILALEFSSSQRSVAVLSLPDNGARNGGLPGPCTSGQIAEVVETGVGSAGALGMVEAVLRQSGLDRGRVERVVIGLGPGSYSGIRGAIALAQGWQLARGVKLQGISSAECLAWQARSEGLSGLVNVVIDAQRDEFYLAPYDLRPETCSEILPIRLARRAEVKESEARGEVLIGPEITRWFPAGRVSFPSAGMLARMAVQQERFVAGDQLEPIYLREISFVKATPPGSRIIG